MHSIACASIKAIASYAESSGQSPALIEPNRIALNYDELWTRILAIGSLLRDAGIGPRKQSQFFCLKARYKSLWLPECSITLFVLRYNQKRPFLR